jgi:hypothetical protein
MYDATGNVDRSYNFILWLDKFIENLINIPYNYHTTTTAPYVKQVILTSKKIMIHWGNIKWNNHDDISYHLLFNLQFVADGVFKAELNNFLTRELAEDGYSGVEVRVTPTRTEIIILATRTGSCIYTYMYLCNLCQSPLLKLWIQTLYMAWCIMVFYDIAVLV